MSVDRVHKVRFAISGTFAVYSCLSVSEKDLKNSFIKYLAPIINEEHILPVKITKEDTGYKDILKVVKQIFKCYKEKAPAFELELKSKLFHLFSLLYKNDLITKKQSIGKIPVNVTSICKKTGASPSFCIGLTKAKPYGGGLLPPR